MKARVNQNLIVLHLSTSQYGHLQIKSHVHFSMTCKTLIMIRQTSFENNRKVVKSVAEKIVDVNKVFRHSNLMI